MKQTVGLVFMTLLAGTAYAAGQESHSDHPAPEKLGIVHFETSCAPGTHAEFERAIALLHSFAYSASRQAFADVAAEDSHCAMAFWGEAMTHYHPLWEPQVDSQDEFRQATDEIAHAATLDGASPRERQYIEALQLYYRDWEHVAPAQRAKSYSDAMAMVAKSNPKDDEAQVFYALSLIATASPTDKSHTNQKQAAAILEPLWKHHPQHPGIPHYLIHAYDNTELAMRGLPAARAYAKIAPSAPHALHMPSHIFTRLGFWNESVASNRAAQAAASEQGDLGEELHAADYLTYAYLQLGLDDRAAKIAAPYHALPALAVAQFKIGYAANAMPVRLAVERHDWERAGNLTPLAGSAPNVAAIVYWARAIGHARAKSPTSPDADIQALAACGDQLRATGNTYWVAQVDAMLKSAQGWKMQMDGDPAQAVAHLRDAADEEDALEKLPVTPGPIVPAREQLGELLLELHRPTEALTEFKAVLVLAPNRRGALMGAAAAARDAGDTKAGNQFRRQLGGQSSLNFSAGAAAVVSHQLFLNLRLPVAVPATFGCVRTA